MTARHPLTSSVMLALLLLRAGAGPVMADCAAEHHDGPAAQAASHANHHPDPAPPCDHPTPDQPSHSTTECALSAGCAATPLQLSEADRLAAGPPMHVAWTTVELPTLVRTVRPVAPPPKA